MINIFFYVLIFCIDHVINQWSMLRWNQSTYSFTLLIYALIMLLINVPSCGGTTSY